jgi:hypothetical protein
MCSGSWEDQAPFSAMPCADGALNLGIVHGLLDQRLDVDVGERLSGDGARVAADLGGEAADLRGVLGPQRADALLALLFRQAFVLGDGLGAFAEGLHAGFEGFGRGLDGAFGLGLGVGRQGGVERQDREGGGEAEDADHGGGSLV